MSTAVVDPALCKEKDCARAARSGSASPARANRRARSDGAGGVMSEIGTLGGEADEAGFTVSHPQRSPWASALCRIPWARRMVAGASGRSARPPFSRSRR
ncbi:MAG: hypothetical protein ACR2LJ_01405 [Acidimicrobiales bacterium]